LMPGLMSRPPMLTAASTMKAWPSNTRTSPVHAQPGRKGAGNHPYIAYYSNQKPALAMSRAMPNRPERRVDGETFVVDDK
jgi:hypothetical protein